MEKRFIYYKKQIAILCFLWLTLGVSAQDSIVKFDVKKLRIKTNLSQLIFKEVNFGLEYQYQKSFIGFGLGYTFGFNLNKLYQGGDDIPERRANRILDLSIGESYKGPHLYFNYLFYYSNPGFGDKKYWNFDVYYRHNNYDSTCIYYGSNGLSSIPRKLIKETGDSFGIRILCGTEHSVSDHLFVETYWGFGFVVKYIERNNVSEGSSGDFRNYIINTKEYRFAYIPTLQLGLKLGFQFKQ